MNQTLTVVGAGGGGGAYDGRSARHRQENSLQVKSVEQELISKPFRSAGPAVRYSGGWPR